MGTEHRIHCPACELGPFEVVQGPFMLTDFFTTTPVWCRRCEVLGDSQVFVGVRSVEQRLADTRPRIGATPLPESHDELAELLLRSHRRPTCPRCERRAVRFRVGEDPCPRCGEALMVEETACVD